MLLRWYRDWRERRAVLAEMNQMLRDDEAILMDRNENPLNLAKLSVTSDPQEAAAQWQRALKVVPNAVLESEDSLEILIGLKRFDEADALMRKRLKLFPHDTFPLTGLARIAEERGDLEEALKRWTVVRERVRNTIYGYHGCGRCLFRLGRIDESEVNWDAALRRGRHNQEAGIWRAMISDHRKDWQQSLVRWEHVAEYFGFAAGFAHYAQALIALGRTADAEQYLETKSRLFPGDLDIAITRAQLAQDRGDLTAACERWAAVRAAGPWHPAGYMEGAHRLNEAGRHAEADTLLLNAIERFPDKDWPFHDYAQQAHARGDWHEAAARWEDFRRRFPDREDGYSFGAEALQAAGRDKEAVAVRSAR